MFNIVFLNNGHETTVATVSGCEAAWVAFQGLCPIADLIGADCLLVEVETDEIVGAQISYGVDLPWEPTADDLAEAWWEG